MSAHDIQPVGDARQCLMGQVSAWFVFAAITAGPASIIGLPFLKNYRERCSERWRRFSADSALPGIARLWAANCAAPGIGLA